MDLTHHFLPGRAGRRPGVCLEEIAMTCPKCDNTRINERLGSPGSDFENWQKWRSMIPLTGLVAVGLKHLFGTKVKLRTCENCGYSRPATEW